MQALTQSSFLQALGYALANSLWQVALMWLAVFIINACISLSPHNRYRLAITAQLAGFACFVVTLQYFYEKSSQAAGNTINAVDSWATLPAASLPGHAESTLLYFAKAEMLLPYLALAYLCMLCLMGARWINSYRFTHRLKRQGIHKAKLELRLFVKEMAAKLGIQQPVKVYFSRLATSPLTIGFLKPVILVPLSSVTHLSPQQLEAVLLHELAHIRRSDYLVNLLLNVVETILFFNPFTRIISQQIHKEREHCCDDWVVQSEYNAAMYAEALLRLACLQGTPALAMHAGAKNKSELTWRVRRLLQPQQKKSHYSQQILALVITTCMLVFIAWMQPGKTNAPQARYVAAAKISMGATTEQAKRKLNSLDVLPLLPIPPALKAAPPPQAAQQQRDRLARERMEEAGKTIDEAISMAEQELLELTKDSTLQKEFLTVKELIADEEGVFFDLLADSLVIRNAIRMGFNKQQVAAQLAAAQQTINRHREQLQKLKKQYSEAVAASPNIYRRASLPSIWMAGNDVIQTKVHSDKAADDGGGNKHRHLRLAREKMEATFLIKQHPRHDAVKSMEQNKTYLQQAIEATTPEDVPEEWDAPADFYTTPALAMPEWDAVDVDYNIAQPFTVFTMSRQLPAAPMAPPPPPAPAVFRVAVPNPAGQVDVIITIIQ